MSPESAYKRLMSDSPMELRDVLAALKYAGGFTCDQGKRKQSHYKVSREGTPYPFILPVKHDGEVKKSWLREMVRHFNLDEQEQEAE